MYAIISSGGKQYRVKSGDEIDVELLSDEAGTSIELKEILFVADGKKSFVGAPHVAQFVIKGTIVGPSKGPKITFMKYRPSQNERKKKGHRQHYSRLRIDEIAAVKR